MHDHTCSTWISGMHCDVISTSTHTHTALPTSYRQCSKSILDDNHCHRLYSYKQMDSHLQLCWEANGKARITDQPPTNSQSDRLTGQLTHEKWTWGSAAAPRSSVVRLRVSSTSAEPRVETVPLSLCWTTTQRERCKGGGGTERPERDKEKERTTERVIIKKGYMWSNTSSKPKGILFTIVHYYPMGPGQK
jgi:hypothetical protein